MLGLRRQPSRMILWSIRAFWQAAKTLSETSAQTSMVWAPSVRISGSTMGTSPLSWQIPAYLARVCAFSAIARGVGWFFAVLMLRTALHLANLQP